MLTECGHLHMTGPFSHSRRSPQSSEGGERDQEPTEAALGENASTRARWQQGVSWVGPYGVPAVLCGLSSMQ